MIKAMVFTNHPKSVQGTMNEKLKGLGIEVSHTSQVSTNSNINTMFVPKEIEVIITMNSLVAQGAKDKIKLLAKRNQKRYLGLGQKLENWKEEIGALRIVSEENKNMSTQHSILDADLPGFCRAFMNGIDTGKSIQDLIKTCSVYFRPGAELRDIHQLIGTVRRLQGSDRAPAFFNVWWKDIVHKVKAKKIAPVFEPLLNNIDPEPKKKSSFTSTSPTVGDSKIDNTLAALQARAASASVPTQKVEPKSEFESTLPQEMKEQNMINKEVQELREMIKLYEESNESLKKENLRLTTLHDEDEKIINARVAEVTHLQKEATDNALDFKRQLAEARAQLTASKSRPTVKKTEDFVEVQNAVRVLMRTGSMSIDTALNTLLQFDPLGPADKAG